MSNRYLEAATDGQYGKPRFPTNLSLLQKLYETRRQQKHPITLERLKNFAEDLKIIALDESTSLHAHCATEDGTCWNMVGFRYISGKEYKLAFPVAEDPKHRDGTVSAQHIALYCNKEDVSDEELEHVAQAAYAIFHTFNH